MGIRAEELQTVAILPSFDRSTVDKAKDKERDQAKCYRDQHVVHPFCSMEGKYRVAILWCDASARVKEVAAAFENVAIQSSVATVGFKVEIVFGPLRQLAEHAAIIEPIFCPCGPVIE